MKTILKLNNPFEMVGRLNLLLLGYGLYPNNYRKVIKPVAYFNYLVSLLARVWGFYRLQRAKHTSILARHLGGRSFSIRDTNSQFQSIYLKKYRSLYEPDVSAAIALFLSDGGVFVDIGSNWGHHTFNAILSRRASVVAFEPNPVVCEDLKRIASELGVEDNIVIHQSALSDRPGELELRQNYFESGVGSISESFSNERAAERHISLLHRWLALKPIVHRVQVLTLDSLGIERADLIKIDAEGVELEILVGAKQTITSQQPVICFEFHSDDLGKFDQFQDYFQSIHYELNEMRIEALDDASGDAYALQLEAIETLKRNTLYNLVALPRGFSLPDQGERAPSL